MEWLGRGYLPVAALQLHAADWKALKWPGFQRLLETSQGSLRALENLPSKPDLHSTLDEFALLLLASKVQDLTLVAGFNVTNKGFRIGDTTRLRTAVLDHSLFEFDCGSAPPGMLRFVRRRAQDPLHLKLPAPLTERQFWQLAATDKQVASLEFMHPHDPTGCPLLENPTFQEG
ncbi:hypothetical protein WJX72_002357 [[Myrmecia] bisecta]|uniref:Uncharacterized protein n=1 Tax=[Myrmecia] bisecta TaxID=41462 RepID=A0AAW1PF80_9CHLO